MVLRHEGTLRCSLAVESLEPAGDVRLWATVLVQNVVLRQCPPRPHPALTPGGYAVLKGLQEGLNLPTAAMINSFAALRE